MIKKERRVLVLLRGWRPAIVSPEKRNRQPHGSHRVVDVLMGEMLPRIY
jgi:hypothetical protein